MDRRMVGRAAERNRLVDLYVKGRISRPTFDSLMELLP